MDADFKYKTSLSHTLIISILIYALILVLAACGDSNQASNPTSVAKHSDEKYLKKGKEIAAATFATLSQSLQKAIQEGGIPNAIQYCNLAAYPLVDSLAQVHEATIRRTSLKVRNPKNTPSSVELAQLNVYQKQFEAGEELKASIAQLGEQKLAFYAPIPVMPLCQKCHGQLKNSLSEENYTILQKYYPEDKAIGYQQGDLRGMWSITLKK